MPLFHFFAAAITHLLFINVFAFSPKCPISISTLEYVPHCPRSEMEWNKRAKEKRCDVLAYHQNCTSVEKFSYHCILNEDATKLVEVCAPMWFMSGYCARFSTQDERIINDPGLDCTSFARQCPPRYNSSEAYKYQTYYEGVERKENKSFNENGHDSSGFPPGVWISVALNCGFLIALIIITAALIITLNRQKSTGKKRSDGVCIQCIWLKTKPDKMPLKRLSDDQIVTQCDVKRMRTIADLKVAVARIFNSSKELIEIVDKGNALLYKEDTSFKDFLRKEDCINVIVRPSTRNERYDTIEDYDDGDAHLLSGYQECKHNTNPDVLFEIIHRLLVGEEIDIKCPACGNKLITDETFDMCDMSVDEKRFYTDKLKRKRDSIN